MAKKAIPEELDVLIQEYLTDGIITDKERQVLLRKAEKLGLDVEEVDLYIDAQQYKADQQVDAAVRKQRGQACPFCGGSVPQLTDKCPHCGQQITVEASDEIKEIIDQLEDALVELKSGTDLARNKANVERYMRKANLYYSNNPKIKSLIEQVNQEMAAASNKKAMAKQFLAPLKDRPNAAGGLAVASLFLIIFIIPFLNNWIKDGLRYFDYNLEEAFDTATSIGLIVIYVIVFFLVRTILNKGKIINTPKNKCPNCGGDISRKATSCPHCGKSFIDEINDEVKEIMTNLGDALAELSTCRAYEINEKKATIKKYINRLELLNNNNPKVKAVIKKAKWELRKQSILNND